MQTTVRPSGIAAVGDIPWGTHFCQFYGDRDDLVDSLVPYFKAGLENQEQCLWVTSEPFRAEDARTLLRQAVPDLEDRIRQGQIEIIDHQDWYMRAGERTADEVLQSWVERQHLARARGYAGLRLTGNTYWLERKDWAGFVEYEARVTETFRHHHIIGLCSYCFERCQGKDVVDVVRNHEFALIRQAGSWEVIESASVKVAKEELRRLNAELEDRVRLRTAELENALRMRDEFLSVASHELKTPITSLQLYMDGLLRAYQRGPLAPEQATTRLGKAKEQCGRLERFINNLLDVSRAASGSLPQTRERVDLAEVARQSAEQFSAELERAGCQLHLEASQPVTGLWDRLRVEQVVTNLLSNAIKYAPGSRVELRVHPRGDQAVLTVQDGGPGIQERDQARIFERFVQVEPLSHAGGFGLGLWIVRKVVEAQGGAITVSSRPGQGSVFTVTLPRQPLN